MSDEHDSIELSFLTIHRGEAAVRWVDRLKGKKTLQEVKWRMLALNDRLGIKQQAAQGKISVRLLEFAEPMIAEAFEGDGEPSAADLESVLKGVVMIWNAKVMEQIGQGSGFVKEIKRLLLQNPDLPAKAKSMTRLMLKRKATKFPDDLRFISDFSVYLAPDGELRVKAEARLALELMD